MNRLTLAVLLIFLAEWSQAGSNLSLAQPEQFTVQIDLERPGEREFILDRADLLTDQEEEHIRQVADQLLTEKMAPLIVVTIKSMAAHTQEVRNIEAFAMLLLNQWGIGFHDEKTGKSWNYGILMLISKNDRRARIELGADWGHEKDALCQQIMNDHIVSRFKLGDYGGGIVAGVDALDKMARDMRLPAPSKPSWYYPAMAVFFVVSTFISVSLGTVGYLLFGNSIRSSSSGGGYSGGSYGGGFSGGGGASGSW